MHMLRLFSLSVVLAVAFIGASTANAAGTVTWNGATSTAWATASNWTITSGTPSTPPGSGDDVIIGDFTPGSQPTLGANTTINSLTINGRSGLLGSRRGGMLTISTGVTLTITGNLAINGATAFGIGVPLGITANGTASVSIGGNVTTTNATNFGPEEPSVTMGSGTFTVTGNLAFGTTTTLTAGTSTFAFNKAAATQTFNGNSLSFYNVTHSGAGTLQLLTNPLAATNSFNNSGGGTFDLAHLAATVGDLQGNGTITSSVAGAIAVTAGGDNASTTFSGVIQNGTGTVSVTKNGTGTLTLSGLNSYSGATTISAGILQLGAAGSGANGPLGTTTGATTVTAGAALDLNGFTLATAEPVTLNGTGIAGGGALTNSAVGAASYSGLITLGSASSIVTNSGDINITNAGTITGATFGLTLGGSGNGSVASIIGTTSGTVTKSGTGTWTLSGSNTYTGLTTVGNGVLRLGAAGGATNTPLGTTGSGTTVTAGAALDLNGFTLGTAEALTLDGTGVAGGGALTNSAVGAASYSGLITLGSASSIVTNAGDINITNAGTITGATFGLTLGGSGNGSVASIIGTTSGTVTKSGTGTWTLSGSNTYTGLTTVGNGVLRLGAAGGATNTPLGTTGSGTTVTAGAALDLNGFTLGTAEALTLNGTGVAGGGALTNSAVGAASYSGLITLGSASSIVTNSGDINITNAGTITGATFGLTLGGSGNGNLASIIGTTSGTVTKSGTGTWTVSGSSTYTGLTTISAGTLRLGAAGGATNTPLGTTGSGTTVTAGAALDLNGFTLGTAEALTLNGTGVAGGGALTNTSAATVTYSGLITLGSASSIATNLGDILITNPGTITGPTFGLTLSGNGDGGIASIIGTTSGTVTKNGTGTWTLGGANTFTGGVTLNAGQLNINNAQALGTVAGTFTINGGTIDNTSGGAITTLSYPQAWNGDFTFTGLWSLNLGTGAVTLSADRQVTVSANTLTVGGAISAGAFSLTKAGAGTLSFGSNTVTLNNLTVSAGTLVSTSGTMNIAGNFSNSGAFTHNSGNVTFNGSGAQAIGGSTTTGFSSLTDANTSAALSVNTNANVSGTLSMSGAATLLSPAPAVVFNNGGAAGTITGTGTVRVTRTAATADYSSQYKFTTNTLTNLTVEYAGSGSAQTVSALTYGGLKINNTSGVTLGGNTTVNGTLTFSNGLITTGANNVAIGTGGSVSGAGSGKYVDGNLQKVFLTGPQSFTFDVGDASNYTPVALSFANVSVGGSVTANTTSGQHPSISTSGINLSKDVARYWSVTPGGGFAITSTYDAGFTFVPGDVIGGANTNNFVVRKFNPSTWTATTTGTKNATSTQATGLTSFGDFAIGEQLLHHFVLALASPQTNAAAFTGTNTLTAEDTLDATMTAFDASADNVTINANSPLTGAVSGLSGGNKLTGAGDFSSGVANLTALGMMYTGNAATGTFTATSASGRTGTSGAVTVNTGAANAAQSTLTPVSATIIADGSSTQVLTVTAKDTSGNTLTSGGSLVTITQSTGTGSIGSVTDNSNGTYTATVTSPTSVGSGVFVATLGGQPVKSGTVSQTQATVTYGPGPLHHFAIANVSSPQVATIAFNIDLTAQDINNNTVTGFGGTVTLSSNSGTISPTTSGAFAGGLRTESVTLMGSGPGRTISVDDGASHTGTSNSFTVDKEPTTSVLTTTPNPSTFEQSVTLKDSVSGSVPDGGKVYFSVDGLTIDSVNIDGSGVASVATSGMTAGSHAISAFYGGTSSFDTSTSNTIPQTVGQATPTVGLTSSLNPSALEQSVTFKAKVDNSSHTPTGSVTFYDGASSLGSFALVGDSAQVSTATLTVGGHTIKVVYGGDSNFKSDSISIPQTVNKAAPTVLLASSANPSTFEQNVTFTAKVHNSSNTPTGSVTFYDGASSLGNFALSGDSAQVSGSLLAAGSHTIKAVYEGDSNFKSDSTTIVQTVNQSGPTVVLTSSLNPSIFQQNVTFKAKVHNASHTPTGSVTFYDGATSLGNFALSGDSAEVSTASLTAGSHTIKAVYEGDGNFKSDSTTIVQTVNKAATASVLTASPNPSVYFQSVLFRDSVSGPPDGGKVYFSVDNAVVDSSLVDVNGIASVSIASLTGGTHAVSAHYGGTGNFDTSTSNAVAQVVRRAATTSTLTTSPNPSVYFQSVLFRDSVSGPPDGGKVYFSVDDAVVDSSLVDVNGIASVSIASLTGGTHAVVAHYGGTGNFDTSSSNSVTQVVNRAATTSVLTTSPNPSFYFQSVLFRDSVSGLSAGPPDGGKVYFSVDNVVTDSAVVNLNGIASVSMASLTVGSHAVSAHYGGTGNFNPSTSNTATQVVNKAASTSVLTTSPNPSAYLQAVLFRDSVSGPPDGGKVYFSVDNVVTDSAVVNLNGIATVSTSSLTVGSHAVSAHYGGTGNFDTSTSNTATQVVKKALTASVLTTSPNPSAYLQAVLFRDSVSGPPDGGKVYFSVDNVVVDSTVVNLNGIATFSTANLTRGTHTVSAFYGGTGNFDTSTSNTASQVVNKKGTTSQLTSSANPIIFGQFVTFKDSVSGSVPDGGKVAFKVDGVLAGDSVAIDGNGVATLIESAPGIGTHSIQAFYGGTGNFDTSRSNIVALVVNPDTFTVTASAGAHGTIAPAGAVRVARGSDQAFTITPDTGYFIADVHVDTVSVGAASSYTFTHVTRNHTIEAFFATHPVPQVTSVAPASAYRGQTVNVVVKGANFITGVSTLNVGSGISINTFTVHTSDSIMASITVGVGTAPGVKSFTVTNSAPGGGTSGAVSFTVLNHAPGAFTLAEPLNGDTVKLKLPPVPVGFKWHRSVDLDAADTLKYILHLLTPVNRDSIAVTTDTSVSANVMSLLAPHTVYTWSVRVTDGFDVVAADTFTFVTSNTVSAVVEHGKPLPKEYALHQNYPNPFNPSTTIRFDLPHQSVVTLVVYNLLGQEVARLADQRTMGAGYQSVRFDASNVPTGAYLYRLSADGTDGKTFVRVMKMMLVR